MTVGVKDNSGFSVSKDNNYLNNWANTNDKVAAYGMDNNTWYFYTPSSGYVATAAKVGQETLVTSEGTDYVITVIEKKPEVKEYTVTATVNNDEMGTAQLNPNASKYKEGTEVTATATVKDESKYEFVNWTVNGKEVSKDAEYTFTVDKDMELKASFKAKEEPQPPVTETFEVTVKANDANMGVVAIDPKKDSYAKEGVHKGMQGIIWEDEPKDGCWVVLFPQCGDKEDIADLYMKEEDLKRIPAMSADVNEQIRAQFDSLEKGKKAEDVSNYMI